ncbi:MAG: ThuA domain-containing protein [Gammaproteobacteria bacterium]|nr:MAG: ThuA domain-containing protein [Gammaproteobacteria bacterium]
MSTDQKIDVYLVCNAKYHDTNFARLELLKLLAEQEDVWVRVAENYSDIDAIGESRLLITYTCDLCPSVAEQAALQSFIERGGRWFALHGTNALVEIAGGKADTPDRAPQLMRTLGSRFVAHPAIETFTVRVTDPAHPLTKGIDDFELEEEPYYCEFFGDNEVLLEASYTTPSSGYVRSDFGTDRESQPQMYLHPAGDGQVLYLTLGHCTGKYDMRPLMDVAPITRCAWNYPVFYELLRRGIRWGIGAL